MYNSLRFLSKLRRTKLNRYNMGVSNTGSVEADKDSYYGVEVLNRVSFLRNNADYIQSGVLHPSTRFIFFEDMNPLVSKDLDGKLAILTNGNSKLESAPIGLGCNNTWRQTLEQWAHNNKTQNHDIRRESPTIFFMGIEDESVGLDVSKLKAQEDSEESEESFLDYQGRYQGIPYFAIDLTNRMELRDIVIDLCVKNYNVPKEGMVFSFSRKHLMTFNSYDASMYSYAKMFIDWLDRNRFCPGCGSQVIPICAGSKLMCINESIETNFEGNEVYTCPVKSADVSNVSFPRTDTVVIAAITNSDYSKILLSLNKRHLESRMYSCTAGFLEPSETIETATKREIWEETGVVTSAIKMVSTQPWPYPSKLMIGCVAVVEFNGVNEIINLDHDKELADAQWFDVEFVKSLLENTDVKLPNPEGIRLPMSMSIAYQLIKSIIDEYDARNVSNKL